MSIRGLALALALSLAAPAAMAQDDAPIATAPDNSTDMEEDAIGDLLADPEAFEAPTQPLAPGLPPLEEVPAPPVIAVQPQPAPTPVQPAPQPQPPPVYALPTRPQLDRPVNIEERGVSPDGPLQGAELGYDMRMRAGVANAQGRQGPLDGGWTVAAADGVRLYNLQVVDPGDGTYALEGAWRSLQRQGIGTTGLLSSLDRAATTLSIRFYRREGGQPTVLTLNPLPDGSWTGELWEEGATTLVTMRRN